ncbi:MAG: GIY-YIG nuclease family protein [Patescibacteria group bacterium]
MNQKWYLYIVGCKDKSLYTGITKDVNRRVFEHNNDSIKGAKSLKGKKPVKLVYYEEYKSQVGAAQREREIKNWKKEYKLKLIEKASL